MNVTDKTSEASVVRPQDVGIERLLVETKLAILTQAFDAVAQLLYEHSLTCEAPEMKQAQAILSRAVTDSRKADLTAGAASDADIAFLYELQRRWARS